MSIRRGLMASVKSYLNLFKSPWSTISSHLKLSLKSSVGFPVSESDAIILFPSIFQGLLLKTMSNGLFVVVDVAAIVVEVVDVVVIVIVVGVEVINVVTGIAGD